MLHRTNSLLKHRVLIVDDNLANPHCTGGHAAGELAARTTDFMVLCLFSVGITKVK